MKTRTSRTAEEHRGWGIPRSVLGFFALAYAIAWVLWLVIAQVASDSGVETTTFLRMVEAQQFEGVTPALPGWLLYLVSRVIDFAFSIAGVIAIAFTMGSAGLRELGRRLVAWRFGVGWYLLALLPIGLFAAATIIAGASPDIRLETVAASLASLEAGLLVSLFLRGAMGEELGLRGFALPRLQERMTPFRAALVVGLLWGLWHLPVLLDRGLPSIVLFLALAVGLSFIFTLLFNASGGSLIPGLLFHATQNWEEGFEVLFPALAGTDWETPSALALLLVGVLAGVAVWRRGGQEVRAR